MMINWRNMYVIKYMYLYYYHLDVWEFTMNQPTYCEGCVMLQVLFQHHPEALLHSLKLEIEKYYSATTTWCWRAKTLVKNLVSVTIY